MFLLCSISSSLEVWSVNHTSGYENSELKFLKNMKYLGEICSNWPKRFTKINVNKTLKPC